ncbi:glycosyltransferase family 2 protein [Dyella amyloliquefaciens]|uniref:glycosyltransferase family 2 protein n=1 Tax=Dyella amyloliquefaciens TaxID=1770545 RepID=UPI00102E9E32|nr:glycosyltransferase family 2 protein [Dyella amyloliquefaciens]
MTEHSTNDVCAIVVTYHPEPAVLGALLEALSGQVAATLIVDNTACAQGEALGDVALHGAHVLQQSQNQGLAMAQNKGIAWARERGYGYVLLLDQDSTPGEGMVRELLAAYAQFPRDLPVAAVGPRFHDLREDRDAPFVRIGHVVNQKLWCEHDRQVLACDFLISSGALIPLSVIDEVGDMDAGLFIDNVDLEWSFRVRAKGYQLYGVCAAMMNHRLGDSRRALPFSLGQVIVHGPTRLYFMTRNRLRLYGMRHTPTAWIIQDVPRFLIKLLLFGVLIGPRLRNLRFMLRGICDGLRGRQGPCPLTN